MDAIAWRDGRDTAENDAAVVVPADRVAPPERRERAEGVQLAGQGSQLPVRSVARALDGLPGAGELGIDAARRLRHARVESRAGQPIAPCLQGLSHTRLRVPHRRREAFVDLAETPQPCRQLSLRVLLVEAAGEVAQAVRLALQPCP